jgi:aspartate/methionine/tyrosine aminotransferase
MVFSGQKHTYLASLPGMQNRTITMCSAGKTFSITGWKVGWLVGPEHLIKPAALAHQWVAFCISTPMQEAVGKALDTAKQPFEGHASYYAWVLAEYTRKREILSNGLRAAGLRPLETQGSFFIMADTCDIAVPETYLYPNGKDQPPAARDYAFCRFLTTEIGVAAIPVHLSLSLFLSSLKFFLTFG